MSLDFEKHSLWLSSESTEDATGGEGSAYWNKYYLPKDDSFFYLGGNSSVSYSNTYNATTTGIYGQGSENAYFFDSASGSVSTITVNCTRVEPKDFDDNDMNNCSNGKVIKTLRDMKRLPQLSKGAYIFRMYNSVQKTSGYGVVKDIPVYLDTYSTTIDVDSPNVLHISLRFIKRSPVLGINLGKTKYDSNGEE